MWSGPKRRSAVKKHLVLWGQSGTLGSTRGGGGHVKGERDVRKKDDRRKFGRKKLFSLSRGVFRRAPKELSAVGGLKPEGKGHSNAKSRSVSSGKEH